jgi:hypothetical protein
VMLAQPVNQHLEHCPVAEIIQLVASCLDSHPQRTGLSARTRIWKQRQRTVGNRGVQPGSSARRTSYFRIVGCFPLLAKVLAVLPVFRAGVLRGHRN